MATAKEAHIGALDGLRALAIVLVLLYHLTPGRDANLGLRSLHYKVADIGWSGVDLFFVLSGFLITTKLLEARGERHRFRNFYARRALRIFPLYYLALAIVFLVDRRPAAEQLPFWLYYSNFAYQPDLEHLGHFWSLAIEEQFYLVWPAVIFLTSSRTARWVCAAMIAGAPILRLVMASIGGSMVTTYMWTPSRIDALGLGAWIALAYADGLRESARRWSYAALALALPLPMWAAWRDHATLVMHPFTDTRSLLVRALLPSATALLYAAMLVMALELRPVARVLTGRVQTLLARYSYGLYVWHLVLVPPLLHVLGPRRLGPMPFFALASGASLIAAVVSYHAYEELFLRLKTRFASPRTR